MLAEGFREPWICPVTLADVAARKFNLSFIEPMLLLRSAELPDDDSWLKD